MKIFIFLHNSCGRHLGSSPRRSWKLHLMSHDAPQRAGSQNLGAVAKDTSIRVLLSPKFPSRPCRITFSFQIPHPMPRIWRISLPNFAFSPAQSQAVLSLGDVTAHGDLVPRSHSVLQLTVESMLTSMHD